MTARRDELASKLSVGLPGFGIRIPENGPNTETVKRSRFPTFDVDAAGVEATQIENMNYIGSWWPEPLINEAGRKGE